MSEEMKLLPCPFCGSSVKIVGEYPAYFAHCEKCKTNGCLFISREKSIAAWNTRTQPRQIPSEDESVEVMAAAIMNTPSHPKITDVELARYEARASYRALTALMDAKPDNTQLIADFKSCVEAVRKAQNVYEQQPVKVSEQTYSDNIEALTLAEKYKQLFEEGK